MSTARLKRVPAPESVAAPIEGTRIGVVTRAAGGVVEVEFAGNTRGPVRARVASTLDDAALAAAARERQECVLAFHAGDASQPIVLALLRSATPNLDAVLSPAPSPQTPRVARVDGKRVEIQGKEEIVLSCGESSLTLRADGTVVLRGVSVVTQARRTNKIRGGKVQIN